MDVDVSNTEIMMKYDNGPTHAPLTHTPEAASDLVIVCHFDGRGNKNSVQKKEKKSDGYWQID